MLPNRMRDWGGGNCNEPEGEVSSKIETIQSLTFGACSKSDDQCFQRSLLIETFWQDFSSVDTLITKIIFI